MAELIWLSRQLAEAIHHRQLAEHGGGEGVRDGHLLESALARPQQLYAYGGEDVDIPALGASLATGLARNHPFIDGNKRNAAVACEVFLELNGYLLLADDAEMYPVFLGLAAGEVSEAELVDWLRVQCRPQQVNEHTPAYQSD